MIIKNFQNRTNNFKQIDSFWNPWNDKNSHWVPWKTKTNEHTIIVFSYDEPCMPLYKRFETYWDATCKTDSLTQLNQFDQSLGRRRVWVVLLYFLFFSCKMHSKSKSNFIRYYFFRIGKILNFYPNQVVILLIHSNFCLQIWFSCCVCCILDRKMSQGVFQDWKMIWFLKLRPSWNMEPKSIQQK